LLGFSAFRGGNRHKAGAEGFVRQMGAGAKAASKYVSPSPSFTPPGAEYRMIRERAAVRRFTVAARVPFIRALQRHNRRLSGACRLHPAPICRCSQQRRQRLCLGMDFEHAHAAADVDGALAALGERGPMPGATSLSAGAFSSWRSAAAEALTGASAVVGGVCPRKSRPLPRPSSCRKRP
jgi:hypothetical protein